MIVRKQKVVPRYGFTLIEMMAVVAIIVMVAGVATVGVMSYMEQAKRGVAKAQRKKLPRQ